jgi:osmotically-inducible protein OsmY
MKNIIKSVLVALFVLVASVQAEEVGAWQAFKSSSEQTWMKAKVFTALVIQPGVSAWNTQIVVEKNEVKLSGIAESKAQAELTTLVAQRYTSKVKSSIAAPAVTPITSGLADTTLSMKVYAALTNKSLVSNSSIKVTCISGCVALTGTALTRAEKELAEELARQVQGVKRVTNLLEVVS